MDQINGDSNEERLSFLLLVQIFLFIVLIVSFGLVALGIPHRKVRNESYIEIQDDYYYVSDNIRLLERVTNPLDINEGKYYLVLHYHDGSRRTIYFKNITEQLKCYQRLKDILASKGVLE